MHFISETRYNPNLQCDDKYYRIKESFRDLTGRVRCRIMLNVGFMTPRLRPEDVRDIATEENLEKIKSKERFEMELTKAKDSLDKPRGKKTYEKVIERLGRAIGKYPSIAKYYVIECERDKDKPQNMKDIRWSIAIPENVDKNSGVYFLRTNVRDIDEETTWNYYNLIREIECTNRQLKTDLNLRPNFHQKDSASDAHLFLGLLSYWVVYRLNTKFKRDSEFYNANSVVYIVSMGVCHKVVISIHPFMTHPLSNFSIYYNSEYTNLILSDTIFPTISS